MSLLPNEQPIRRRFVQKPDSGRLSVGPQANGTPDKSTEKAETRRVMRSIRERLVQAVAEGEGTTPLDGNEVLRKISIAEAGPNDIGNIMRIYDSLLYDRSIFEDLCDVKQRENEQYLRSLLKKLASGGELSPISRGEWESRMKEERLQIVKDKADVTIGANSYVFPDSDVSRRKILDRFSQMTLKDESHKRWFDEIEKKEARNVIMVNDTFFLRDSGKGLLQETYRQMIEYEMMRNPDLISQKNLESWYIYYYVNSFANVREEGTEEGQPFLFPGFNRATVVSTVRAGGSIIGSTHPEEYKKLVLPDAVPGKDYITKNGKRILIDRPFIDVMIPAVNFLS
jgi:hypothetical protein